MTALIIVLFLLLGIAILVATRKYSKTRSRHTPHTDYQGNFYGSGDGGFDGDGGGGDGGGGGD